MILHKHTKMETLSQIVNREFEANIFNHSKKQNNVNARKVFCKILSDIGFSSGDICGFLKRDYGVYMYYMRDVENHFLFKTEVGAQFLWTGRPSGRVSGASGNPTPQNLTRLRRK